MRSYCDLGCQCVMSCQVLRNSLKTFLRYHIHNNETDGQTSGKHKASSHHCCQCRKGKKLKWILFISLIGLQHVIIAAKYFKLSTLHSIFNTQILPMARFWSQKGIKSKTYFTLYYLFCIQFISQF